MAEEQQQGNVIAEYNLGVTGLNMDNIPSQIQKGQLSYALNAAVENFDSNSVTYQNEPCNEFCLTFPDGYLLIGKHFIQEQNKHIFFLANPDTGGSEIGYMDNNDCVYRTLVNAKCLNFNINYPIHKSVHKLTNCTTELYWTDGYNPRRYLDIDNIPYKLSPLSTACDPIETKELDCNQINVQPNFQIPNLEVVDVMNGGDLIAGTYQFAIQYCSPSGIGYTSFYSITNPTPIGDTRIITANFNYPVGKSIKVNISNLDTTGLYTYFNLAVIKTINAITSAELIGTYFINGDSQAVTYTGQNVTNIRLTMDEIFEKYPYYEIAQDVTAARDILIWDQLSSIDRINYQSIANQIQLQWETWRIPANENYADELNATNLRGYMRDEVYAFEIVFLLSNGKQTDGFHIPGRTATSVDTADIYAQFNDDFIGEPTDPTLKSSPAWKIYNTASVAGFSPGYSGASDYKGPYQYGDFAYWESTELYPCNTDLWGTLAGQPIRHHKFPDVSVSPIIESALFSGPNTMVMQNDAAFPIGVRIDISQIQQLIQTSNLTQEQKDQIVGFKIVRGDRAVNNSIVAKGILRNLGKYVREETSYYFPNYPYNDVNPDPFLLDKNNAYSNSVQANSGSTYICRKFSITVTVSGTLIYIDCNTGNEVEIAVDAAVRDYKICSLSYPSPRFDKGAKGVISCLTFDVYKINVPGSASSDVDFKYTPPGDTCWWDFTNGNKQSPPLGYNTWNDFCALNSTNACCDDILKVNKLVNVPIGSTKYIWSLVPPVYDSGGSSYTIEKVATSSDPTAGLFGPDALCEPSPLNAFTTDESKERFVFNSPETSFGNPFLGDVLKIENVMFGAGKAHFVQVKDNAKYRLVTKEAQIDALNSSYNIANITGTFNVPVLFAGYQAYLTIYINGITRKNYAYSFNSIASYDYTVSVDNGFGIKQREIDIAQYLIPGVQSVGDPNGIPINNWSRETSVFVKTKNKQLGFTRPPLPFASDSPNAAAIAVKDDSRYVLSDPNRGDCNLPGKEDPIKVIAYYGSIKNIAPAQWGQIYSYDTIDTGFQRDITPVTSPVYDTVFGGDTFITRFAFKTKLPFFIDNRVNAPDDSDIFYDEIGNVAYPKYWHSARSILSDASVQTQYLKNFISIKAHNFDCPNSQTPADSPGRTYYDGKFYLFAYGIPNFYCETTYNVDLRQAFNNREGDFWPHVSTSIPDDWVQESFVPIIQDNTYYYNTTFSKQNKENVFTHLPNDWDQVCFTYYPFRAIYSETQSTDPDSRANNWLIYKPMSYFDFPQNYGSLISLDGIQNKAILARFQNKSLLYNTLLTIDTSNPQAAYMGNDTLFRSSPPIDFAETDLGYVGSQHKFLLKIPQGQITVDAKRGQVFLISGNQAADLSAFGSGMNRFFTDHLAFEILRHFPNVPIDNNFNGIGLHGVYDSKFDRVIITKIDYVPKSKDIKYDATTNQFYIERVHLQVPGTTTTTTTSIGPITSTTTTTLKPMVVREQVYLTDEEYFCNKSWTLSFNLNTKSWVSFHSYIPNFYIGENNFFYSGLNDCCADFDAVVGTLVPNPTTTSTTSTSTSTTSTTSTTTTQNPCLLDGVATVVDCSLVGDAQEITTTTTTTLLM